ncbi:ArsR/SmtB family transcription factor [Flavobacterium silvaticum]|uniref:Winged helix-turn-helix transcriptional regulator n=1 Tax=Flavobacterium silvaticum TaxID=1852020 RepID=A0A972JHZ6_9FLAO|nr:metalloregulator ArsR/SmtB family transcription factor [Flavobacterium silvaticum]NMH26772.1 winged helix-turn-helix transcriptional regulator [Flavobacterium silvaticum]
MKRDVFQALADPTRRAILLLIAAQAMTPNAVAEHFKSSRQAVSKHLQVLSEADLLTQQKNGREIFYHLNPDRMTEVEEWITKFKSLLATKFEQLDNVLEQLKNQKS